MKPVSNDSIPSIKLKTHLGHSFLLNSNPDAFLYLRDAATDAEMFGV